MLAGHMSSPIAAMTAERTSRSEANTWVAPCAETNQDCASAKYGRHNHCDGIFHGAPLAEHSQPLGLPRVAYRSQRGLEQHQLGEGGNLAALLTLLMKREASGRRQPLG
jgi:hypothetical protein